MSLAAYLRHFDSETGFSTLTVSRNGRRKVSSGECMRNMLILQSARRHSLSAMGLVSKYRWDHLGTLGFTTRRME